mmetsp:Transcript_442/g.413  ORF Transcript_442/g.413 Transcript_442/m.413 type:complete len:220 (-) Transcript_442:69-728(-)
MNSAYDERVRKTFLLLSQLDADQISSFCQLSISFLEKRNKNKDILPSRASAIKSVRKRAEKIARKLGEPSDRVEDLILGLSNLFLDAARNRLNQPRFKLSLQRLEINASVAHAIAEFQAENSDKIRRLVEEASELESLSKTDQFPEYVDLRWRLDMEIASRSLQANNYEPSYLLRIDTTKEQTLLKADFATLQRIHSELQTALDESKSVHSQRIFRYIR